MRRSKCAALAAVVWAPGTRCRGDGRTDGRTDGQCSGQCQQPSAQLPQSTSCWAVAAGGCCGYLMMKMLAADAAAAATLALAARRRRNLLLALIIHRCAGYRTTAWVATAACLENCWTAIIRPPDDAREVLYLPLSLFFLFYRNSLEPRSGPRQKYTRSWVLGQARQKFRWPLFDIQRWKVRNLASIFGLSPLWSSAFRKEQRNVTEI